MPMLSTPAKRPGKNALGKTPRHAGRCRRLSCCKLLPVGRLLLAGRLLAGGLLAGRPAAIFEGGGRAGDRPVTLPEGLRKLFIFL